MREREVHYPQRAEWAAQAAGGCQWACELVREIGPLSSGAVARWHGACGGTALALAYATRRVSHHVRDAACRSRARFDCRSSAQRSPVLCAWSVRVEFSGTCDVRRLSCLYSSFSVKLTHPRTGKPRRSIQSNSCTWPVTLRCARLLSWKLDFQAPRGCRSR